MELTAEIILAVCLVVGVAGTLLPGLPGCGIILAGALVYAAMTHFKPIDFLHLVGYTGLFLVSWIGQFVVTALGSKRYGSTKYGAWGAAIGSIVGLFIPVFGGLLIGAFLGAFLFEIFFAVKHPVEGARAGFGALVGMLFSLFYEFTIALFMVGLISWQVWW